jgi:hypothetical protein
LYLCKEKNNCEAITEGKLSPFPDFHYHFDSDHILSFYNQSSTLYFLSPLREILKTKNHNFDIMLASDARLLSERPGHGTGAFPITDPPIYIPTAHRLLKYCIRSIAKRRNSQYVGNLLTMIKNIEEYVDGEGLLDEQSLEPRCKEFYQGLKSSSKDINVLLDELEAVFAVPLSNL